jgi:hypothetical protein
MREEGKTDYVELGRGWINLAQNLWVLEERVIKFLDP